MENKIKDINERILSDGDIIDIHQTVNGESKFIVMSLTPLDIRYHYDISRVYEYDMMDLISPSFLTGEVDFEIIGNIFLN